MRTKMILFLLALVIIACTSGCVTTVGVTPAEYYYPPPPAVFVYPYPYGFYHHHRY